MSGRSLFVYVVEVAVKRAVRHAKSRSFGCGDADQLEIKAACQLKKQKGCGGKVEVDEVKQKLVG